MPLMYGNDKISNFPWANEEIARAYWGDELIYESKPWYFEYGVLADYVISNGIDNWIDSWLAMNLSKDGVIIEMDIEYLNITTTEINAFGAVSGSGSSRQVVETGSIVNGKTAFYGYSSNGAWKITDFNVLENINYKFRYELRSGLQIMFVDDVEVWRTTDTVNITSSNAMTLFARSYSNMRGGFVKAKWRRFKMTKLDGTPIADYTPLYVSKKPILDRENNSYPVGSYILVDNVRKEATVLHGAPLDGYADRELQWFETIPNSTGIKTNFIPNSQNARLTKIELMCSFTSGSTGYLVNGIGGGPTMYIGMNPTSKLAYGSLAADSSISYVLNYNTFYKLTIDYKNKTLSVNDEIVASNITLFTFNKDNVNFGLNCYVKTVDGDIINNWGQKTKYCKIYVDDILTHHWVGKFNNEKVDIYDKVENVYLGDLGLIENSANIIAGE